MKHFKVIPAMDLMDGRCVRLTQGDYTRQTVYPHDPVELAGTFLDVGLDWLHVVDLDGARVGRPVNLETVAILAETGIGIELGGGIRTSKHIEAALDSGVKHVILGSSLLAQPDLLPHWLDRFPGRLVAAVDVRDGQVAIHAWQETAALMDLELIAHLEQAGFSRVVYTDIKSDGTLQGPNLSQLQAIAKSTTMAVTASGGIGSVADIQAVADLAALGVTGVIVGKAFYEGKVTMEELASCQSDRSAD